MNESNNQRQKRPVAIKVIGTLKGSKIEGNTCINTDLLEADGVENSSINRNKVISSNNSPIEIIGRDKMEQHGDKNKASIENKKPEKEIFMDKVLWKFIVPIIIGLIVIYLAVRFGWQH
ncbi:MAG: hypothetical protein PHU56_03045 [Candidatus Pacebacteria bacterium]|nr:hypothetical protein [Candidatus Paceibacterota bacterium]